MFISLRKNDGILLKVIQRKLRKTFLSLGEESYFSADADLHMALGK